jgi:hypothetical protein
MSDFPTEYYYVYIHKDPITGNIKYIGMGQGQRAWMMRNSGGTTAYGHRCKEHWEWYKELESKGYTLDKIVEIIDSSLSRSKALEIEKEMINSVGYGKLFNKDPRLMNRKHDKEMCNFAKALHELGFGYQRVAHLMGADNPKTKAMAVKRMIQYAD